jgi:hypothetical protein
VKESVEIEAHLHSVSSEPSPISGHVIPWTRDVARTVLVTGARA